jgi:hypothetical protein
VKGGGTKNEPEDNESVPTYQEAQRDPLQVLIEVILPLMSHYGVLGTEYFGSEILRPVRVEILPIRANTNFYMNAIFCVHGTISLLS